MPLLELIITIVTPVINLTTGQYHMAAQLLPWPSGKKMQVERIV